MKIKKQLSLLVLMAVLCGICACGQSKVSSQSQIVQGRRGTGTAAKTDTEAIMDTEEEEEEVSYELFVVAQIDTEEKKICVEKVGSGRQFEYVYDTGTKFLDKYGNTKAMTAFVPGDVVEIQATGNEYPLKQIQLSEKVWVQDEISNYSVDENIKAFVIGKTKYQYAEGLEVFSGDKKVNLRSLGKKDEIRVVGIDKEIISVAITKGHGYLALANTKLFEGSFICIGEKIFQEVTANMQVEVPEGTHLVTVANNGYGGSREVTIERNKTTRLDLDGLKGEGPKICKITFKVGVEGAILQIDGKDVDYSKPVEVQYGVHKIAVSAEGYDTISEKLVVNSKEAEIEIALTSAAGDVIEEETEDTKTDDTETKQEDDGSTDTNTNEAENENNENTGTNNDGSSENNSTDESSTDYLTTLYNLLNSINTNNSGTTNNYDDLHDG
ncbi:MAG: hypothetical protein J6A75_02955 [Lachnospiraceae bacterium]|nr:hypothetical protein [Lachnospiraceae bacterium]